MKMENKIRELIAKYNVKMTEKPLHYFQWIEFIDDLNSLLKFKQENCCGSKKGILSTLDDVAKYNYSKSEIRQAYNEGYEAGQEGLRAQSDKPTAKIPYDQGTQWVEEMVRAYEKKSN